MDKSALVAHFKSEATALIEKLAKDEYDSPEAKAADNEAMTKALANAEKYAAEVKADAENADAIEASKKRLEELGGMEAKGDDEAQTKGDNDPETKGSGKFTPVPETKATVVETPTAGEAFVKSEAYTTAATKGFGEHSPAIAVEVETKSLITSPSLPSRNRYESYAPTPLTILDVINVIDTGAEAIVVHRLLLTANNAAFVADGVASPESDFTWQTVTITPATIAHWVPVDNNTMNDHGTVRGIIDVELAWAVRDKIQTQIMTDLASTTGLLQEAFATDVVTTLLNGKTTAEAVRTPTAIIMNPSDVNALQLLKGTDGHYIAGGPFQYSGLVVWGLPVVSASACPVGTAYIGNTASIIWRNRQNVEITTGWRNTQFTDRQLSIMATARGMLDVTMPGAMVAADLTA